MTATAATRRQPTASPSTSAEIAVANRIEVSRRAATIATGASVIAHRATPYEVMVPTPPISPSRQPRRAWPNIPGPRRQTAQARTGGAVSSDTHSE